MTTTDEKASKKSVVEKPRVVEFLAPFTLVTSIEKEFKYRFFKPGMSFSPTDEEMQYLKDQRAIIKIDGL